MTKLFLLSLLLIVGACTPAPAPPINNNNAFCTKQNQGTTLICDIDGHRYLAKIVGGKK